MTIAPLPPPARDRVTAIWTAYTLGAGVITSAVLIAVGYVLLLLQERPVREPPHSMAQLSGLAIAADPAALASLGLFILIATSFLRVLVAVVLFARERDRPLFLISTGVLVVLVVSLWLGKVD